jgi:NAD(P)-dependent dehydrogenase (short-subunit alcohol dehydrogenase family)
MTCAYDLKDKVALVTGAASGIGRATAELMARSGAKVCIADIHEQGAEAVARSIIQNGGQALACKLDVTSEADNLAVVAKVLDQFGRLDVAHLNAGIVLAKDLLSCDLPSWKKVLAVNLDGVFLGIRSAAPAMSQGKGAIVVTASMSGLIGSAGLAAYIASKHGVVGLVKAAAIELGPNIRVNAVCPGATHTPMLLMPGTLDDINNSPLGRSAVLRRVAEPHEVAQLVCFLASPAASYITGVAYPVDGGISASGIPIARLSKLAETDGCR